MTVIIPSGKRTRNGSQRRYHLLSARPEHFHFLTRFLADQLRTGARLRTGLKQKEKEKRYLQPSEPIKDESSFGPKECWKLVGEFVTYGLIQPHRNTGKLQVLLPTRRQPVSSDIR